MAAGTSYAKRYAGGFVDKPTLTTPIDQAFLNAVEAALGQLIGVAPTADGQVMQWDFANTRYGPALLLNKNIDAAAAIDKSKLNLTGQISDADIAGAAAIAGSKLNLNNILVQPTHFAAGSKITTSAISGGPPATPSSGDIWIATGVDALGTRWAFQYNAGSASAYKWEFIGGPAVRVSTSADETTSSTAYVALTTAVQFTLARGGDYLIDHGCGAYASAFATSYGMYQAVSVGAHAAADNEAAERDDVVTNTLNTISTTIAVTGVSAGDIAALKYRVAAGTTAGHWRNRWLKITPIRVS